MKKYILSVDGGNTKTDYLLTDSQGNFIAIGRYGTCSHEQFSNGFEGMYDAMNIHLNDFFSKNQIKVEDILHTTFGLAGCDVKSQHKMLCEKIRLLGFKEFDVSNDALLGLFAASNSGVGVCSVCGTGTVTVGIDENYKILQVGGIGTLSRDFAGGAYLFREVVGSVYETYFRNGKDTILCSSLENILEYEDKHMITELINEGRKIETNQTNIIKALDEAVINNDAVAVEIMEKMAINLANGTIGCIKELDFKSRVDIVLIGSIWNKLKNKILINTYKELVNSSIKQDCNFTILDTPPAVGGIFNSINKSCPITDMSYKDKLLGYLSNEKYEEIIGLN